LFLLLRLMWMSVIVYAATSKVLVPLLGLDPRATPWLCLILVAVTVMYTTMGGLRAVVLTDVLQSGVLFGSAIVTLVVVTVALGGVHAWWPAAWESHWQRPVWFYDPEQQRGVFLAMLAQFTWFVCTSGSDQIAIQRYLATRDAKAARTVLGISLAADAMVALILAGVGFGLLAYFRARPYLLADGQTILGDADKLFPHFIVVGLPAGLSGLVVAGLLAAAMSALSAGVNSTSSVITVDFLDRFRRAGEGLGFGVQGSGFGGRGSGFGGRGSESPQPSPDSQSVASEAAGVHRVKLVSALVGCAVVCLSLGVNMIHGNLLELCYKVVNLLTAPLFGLFFMAMFVRWATGFGTLVGGACGLTAAVAISYWKEFTGAPGISFLWALPVSLAVEVAVASVASLVPIGRPAAPLGRNSLGPRGLQHADRP
jgi:SSS family solute:Na+ symporter